MKISDFLYSKGSSVIKNASYLFMAHFAGRILSFAITIILPRYLSGGFEDLGKYFFALWLANLLSSITELGLHTPLIRDVTTDKSKAASMISNAFIIRIALSFVTLIIIIILALFVYSDISALIIIVGIAEIMNAISQLLRCMFRAFENMEFEALGVILERTAVFALGLFIVYRGYGIVAFGVAVLIASVLNLVFTLLAMSIKCTRINILLLDRFSCIQLLRSSLPYALSSILYMAYFRIDGIMLKSIMGTAGDAAMGWYGTGYSFVNALTIIPGAFMGAVFPVMSRAYCESYRSKMDSLYTESIKLMFIIVLPIVIGVSIMSDDIVMLLYPPDRFSAKDREALSIILAILIWSGALTFINTVITTVFRASDKRSALLVITASSLIGNFAFNLALIPRYSYIGTSVSMVISEFIFFICGLWYVEKYVCRMSDFSFLYKSLFSSFFMLSILLTWKYVPYINKSIHFILALVISVVAYIGIMVVIKKILQN